MQDMFQTLTQSLPGQHLLGYVTRSSIRVSQRCIVCGCRYRYLYDHADRGEGKATSQRRFENLFLLGLLEKVAETRPRMVLCTHFLPAQLLTSLRKHSPTLARTLPVGVVLTDLDAQSMWVFPGVDRYFAPREEASIVLQAHGIAAATVTVSGIPVDPSFAAAAVVPRAAASEAFAASQGAKDPACAKELRELLLRDDDRPVT